MLLTVSACVSAATTMPSTQRRPARSRSKSTAVASTREDAYRANNVGVALLEQFKYREGAEAFERALRIEPRLALARINLAIALFNVPDPEAARREAEAASADSPDTPQPFYILGLLAKSQNRSEEAIASFRRVLQLDPEDVGANVSLGQVYAQQRKYAEAVPLFRAALAAEPYNGTALYNLGTALLRMGQREEGQRFITLFQQFRQRGSGTTIGQNYMEQGRYAEAVASTGAEADLVDKRTPDVVFDNATEGVIPANDFVVPKMLGRTSSGNAGEKAGRCGAEYLGSVLLLFDFDGDGDLDLLAGLFPCVKLYRNDGGKFADVTARSGLPSRVVRGTALGAVAGDYDNDGRPDLLIVRSNALSLYHNDGGGRFRDVNDAAHVPAYPYSSRAAAFVDADHDGDLDIFIAGGSDISKAGSRPLSELSSRQQLEYPPAPNLFLRNNGDGTFTDATVAAKLDSPAGHAVAVVATDFDNRRDVDLLVVRSDAPPILWKNMRDGTFRDTAAEVGLDLKGGEFGAVAAGDVNKDGFTDFYFGREDGPGEFAMSDGKGRFKVVPAPPTPPAQAEPWDTSAAQFLDYDNDGLLDLLTVYHRKGSGRRLRVLRNTGDGWSDVSDTATRGLFVDTRDFNPQPAFLASGDLDGDGDVDLIISSLLPNEVGRHLVFARNDGGNHNRSLRVSLAGKVSNRGGVGCKVELRAGSLRQKLETYSSTPAPAPADVLFGLGSHESADAVRVLWPSGVMQAEIEANGSRIIARAKHDRHPARAARLNLAINELDRKPSSCPYLYAWNGERFEFITDFMGGGEMGYLEEPGRYNKPDPVEYVRIRGDQLKERGGRYELRVTNELEEALFADRFQLVAVAHPRGTEVYPNEGMTDPPRPFVLYKTRGARPPLSASDEHGHDVLARIARMDRRYPDDFRRDSLRGYAEEHTLTLRLAEDGATPSGRALLLMTGWTDYAWSSDNVAASQAKKEMKPPALQVKDRSGEWKTVIEDIGIPVGRPQTVTVDLTGKFLSTSREVRIVTNMRILWDEILVDTSVGDDFDAQMTTLDPLSAALRWRGFSRETTPDGREPFGYDYERVSYVSPWKVMPGHYTREGDVRQLLLSSDDMFVVSRPGDEISLAFDAAQLPPLRAGWTRTFLLYADGFSKEMDINSASPDQLSPLPFHGMSGYPYAPPEAYPMTDERRAYLERYNTRFVESELPSIDSLLLTSTYSTTPAHIKRR
jgi:Tfp pilus assembly protein PilF